MTLVTNWRKLLVIGGLMLVHTMAFACPSVNDVNFADCTKDIVKISNSNAHKAAAKFEAWKSELSSLSLGNQITYYSKLSTVYSESGKYDASQKIAEQGLSLAKSNNVHTFEVVVLMYNIGFAIEIEGKIESAGKWYREGLVLAKELGHIPTIVEGHLNVGAYFYQTDQMEKSLIEMIKAEEYTFTLSNSPENIEIKGEVAGEIGNLYGRIGQNKDSIKYQQLANYYFSKIGKTEFVLTGYGNIAATYVYLKDYENAAKTYQILLKESEPAQFKRHHFSALTGFAMLKREQQAWSEAYALLTNAERIIGAVEQIDFKVGLYLDKAEVLMELSHFDLSEKALRSADDLLLETEKDSGRMLALSAMKIRGELLKRTGNLAEAYALQSKYVEVFIKVRKMNADKMVEELRIKYETEQAKAKNVALIQKNKQIEKYRYEQDVKMIVLSFILLLFSVLLGYQFILKRRLTIAATTDGLTQVMNRRFLSERGTSAFDSASSADRPLSVIMLDVDHFKHVNDKYGHNVGDIVLQTVSRVSQSAMRKGDYFGRWGGEEFVAVLPGANNEAAVKVAERIAKALSDHDWSEEGLDYNVTASIGVLSCLTMSEPEGFSSLVDQADAAMYRAKNSGRNRIVTAEWLAVA